MSKYDAEPYLEEQELLQIYIYIRVGLRSSKREDIQESSVFLMSGCVGCNIDNFW